MKKILRMALTLTLALVLAIGGGIAPIGAEEQHENEISGMAVPGTAETSDDGSMPETQTAAAGDTESPPEGKPGGEASGAQETAGQNPGAEAPRQQEPDGEAPGGRNPGGENPGENEGEAGEPGEGGPDMDAGEENPDGQHSDEQSPDGDTPDGDTPDEDNPGEDNPGGQNPDEQNPDEDTPDGQNPDEDTPDEDTPDGQNPDEDTPDEGEPSAGEADDGNQPPDALPDGAQIAAVRRLMPGIIRDGDTFWVEAELVGLDGVNYALRWQYDDGQGWQDMPDAHEARVAVIANRDNINYNWRIVVTVAAAEDEAPQPEDSAGRGGDLDGAPDQEGA